MKIKSLPLLTLITAMGLTGCGGSTATSSEGQNLLKVGMECAYAPFNWTQENDVLSNGEKAQPIFGTDDYAYGYDVMMAEKLAKELGYDGVEIHRSEWDSLGMGLDVGDFDCIIAGMSVNPDRSKVYDFTNTYYNRETVVTVKKGTTYENITKLSEFEGSGAKVTTQIGTAWVDLIPQIPGVTPTANYATTAECFLAVSNQTADITVIDLPTTQSALLTNNDLVVLDLEEGFDDTTTNVCIAVKKGDSALQEKINKGLESLEWDNEKMNQMMEEAITLQPANN